MQLVEQHIIKRKSPNYKEIDNMAFRSKNLYNATLYAVRQHFFKTEKYLNFYTLQPQFQKDNQPDYYALPTKVSQQTMKMVDQNFKSFFEALKSYKKNPAKFTGRPKIPKYLNKENGRFVLTFTNQAVSRKWLKEHKLIKLSGLDITIPTDIAYENLNQVRIVQRLDSYVIEIIYTVNEIPEKSDNTRYAAVDLGVNNLATVVSNVDSTYIINGKPLKSINHYYNKKKALYQSQQTYKGSNFRKIRKLTHKRNNKVKDYLHKASKLLVNQLVSSQINTLIIGKTKGWKQDINIGKVNNQNFVQIPFNTFIQMIQYKCQFEGIRVILREESYTSKASFLDNDKIPSYKKDDMRVHVFSGKRIKRGLYKTGTGKLINADVNGAFNILRKAVPNIHIDGIQVCSTPLVKTIK